MLAAPKHLDHLNIMFIETHCATGNFLDYVFIYPSGTIKSKVRTD